MMNPFKTKETYTVLYRYSYKQMDVGVGAQGKAMLSQCVGEVLLAAEIGWYPF